MVSFLQTTLDILLVVAAAAWASICPVQYPSDTPRFTEKLGALDYAILHHDVVIRCCSEGYDNISWYRQEGVTWVSYPPASEGDADAPVVEEKGQILRIPQTHRDDNRTYRCDVERDKKVALSHDTQLEVVDCDKLARGPIPTIPHPENKTIFEYGGNLSFYCSGYFGCTQDGGDSQLNIAQWRVDKKVNIPVWNISDRYHVSDSSREGGAYKYSTLTITNVQEIDTRTTFLCILASPQEILGTSVTPVRISKQDKPKTPWLTIGWCIGGGVLFIFVVILLITLLKCLYGPRIRLFVNSHVPSLGPKLVDDEQFEHNVYIHHAAEDETFAANLKEDLTGRGHKVAITNDVEPGQKFLTKVFEIARRSASIFVVYSDNLLEDEMAEFIIQSLVQEKSGRDIIFLEVTDYQAEALMNRVANARKPDGREIDNPNDFGPIPESPRNQEVDARAEDSVQEGDGELVHENNTEATIVDIQTVDNGYGSPEGDSGQNQKTVRKDDVNDLEYWKVLPRIKVPSENASARKQTNYLCSIQNRIPKFKSSLKKREKKSVKRRPELSSSSGAPLLPSQPASPDAIEDFSPNTDNVFEFGDENSATARGNDKFQDVSLPEGTGDGYVNTSNKKQRRMDSATIMPEAHEVFPSRQRANVENTDRNATGQNCEHAVYNSALNKRGDEVFGSSGEETRSILSSGYGEGASSGRETELTSSGEPRFSSASSFERPVSPESLADTNELNRTDLQRERFVDNAKNPSRENNLKVEINRRLINKTGSIGSPESGYNTTSPR